MHIRNFLSTQTTKVGSNNELCLMLLFVANDPWLHRSSLVEYGDDVAGMVCCRLNQYDGEQLFCVWCVEHVGELSK